MKSPRRSLAIAAVVLSPLLLSGCEKPNPGVTVWSGTASEHVQALCWAHAEVGGLTPAECAQDVLDKAGKGEGIASLEVSPGGTVGISVDPVVAEGGWSVSIAGQSLASGLTDTYYRFTFPEQVATEGTGFTLQVIASAEPNGQRGYWFFQLVPR
ncbi:MAG: hypothetical protein WCF36_06830 [Candidatus Nanopelagicales bacterium]